MINNDNLMPTNVSNIISDFSKLVRNFSMKETSWHIQKEEYEKRISELEGEVKAHENINIDLLKRIRMLEYALSQERQKNNTNNNNEPSQLNKNNMMNIGISGDVFNDLAPQQLLKEEDLQFLKESANRPSLLSVLQSIGIDENLAKNLFDDFELNKTELEQMIKKNLDEKIAQATQETNNINSNNNTNNEIFNITKMTSIMVVNIPKDLTQSELSNGYKIRRASVDLNIPLITNARLADAFINAFCTLDVNGIPIKSWDEFK